MNLSGIISISGKGGLFVVCAQSKNSVIVQDVETKKKFPAFSSDRISALEDISIYTYEEDMPLSKVYRSLFENLDGKEAPSHKEELAVLEALLRKILPEYDEDRVRPSDIKKLFQWYNLLQKAEMLKLTEEVAEETEKTEE